MVVKNIPVQRGGRKLNYHMVIILVAFIAVGTLVGFLISGSGMELKDETKRNRTLIIDYTLGIVDASGVRVIQTTDRQVAIDSNMYSPFNAYVPINITVGSPDVLAAFSEQLTGMEAGGEKTFYIPPENAYGSYNPHLLQTFPLGMINATQLRLGSRITGDVGTGIVTALNATHATIDFNHPLAGFTLVYRVKVLRIV